MSDQENPQIYLITPAQAELSAYTRDLAELLDCYEVACVRLGLQSEDESTISRHADQLREVCHERDVSAVITQHFRMVTSLGLDGVHLMDGAKSIRDVREELKEDAIVGTNCGTSKHTGMTAGEIGADYVSFGPVGQSALGDGSVAGIETFEWWSQVVELPVVAEGNITMEIAEQLAPVTDFFALGSEVWNSDQGAKSALGEFIKRINVG